VLHIIEIYLLELVLREMKLERASREVNKLQMASAKIPIHLPHIF
jgi:hypothetical protein